MQLQLTGSSGVTYQIQFNDQAIGLSAWLPLTQIGLLGDSSTITQASFQDPMQPNTQRFYRAMVLTSDAVTPP